MTEFSALSADAFDDFFEAVHKRKPFPWQSDLARVVVRSGWPPLLDLPTGSGKTAAIDIAIFALAFDADKARRAPLRTFFVVDRRIIVDDAYERARRIADALSHAEDGILKELRARLGSYQRSENGTLQRLSTRTNPRPPLQVVRLRGGVPKDTDWAETPTQPLVVLSTVDQVGSRLLFRGYGVRPKMLPVHAGLVGSDALWLLDEVHIAQPLDETLRSIHEGHESGMLAQERRLAPFHVARLSATPAQTARRASMGSTEETFSLSEADRRDPVLGRRLSAPKRAIVETSKGSNANAAVTATEKLIVEAGAPVRVAVIVNTVATARAVFEALSKSQVGERDVHLLIGRVRDIDRPAILEHLQPVKADPERGEVARTFILVATQTIEAGADIDVDVLVTELASLDSLRQRFGRLNRLGLSRHSRGWILIPDTSDEEAWNILGRIYGDAASATKKWLTEIAGKKFVDFGIDAMDAYLRSIDDERRAKMIAPKRHAPALLPSYAAAWAMTAPVQSIATPAPDLFLHGRTVSRDVRMLWRADIPPLPASRGKRFERADIAAIEAMLEAAPPSTGEMVEVPIHHARRFLERGVDVERNATHTEEAILADLPIEEADQVDRRGTTSPFARCLVYRGNARKSTVEMIATRKLRVGDIILVPATAGGYDRYGWAPLSPVTVFDRGDEAHFDQRRRRTLRLSAGLVHQAVLVEDQTDELPDEKHAAAMQARATRLWATIVDRVSGSQGTPADVYTVLSAVRDLPKPLRERLKELEEDRRVTFVVFAGDDDLSRGFALVSSTISRVGKQRGRDQAVDEESGELSGQLSVSGDDASSRTGVAVLLSEHSEHVRRLAKEFAEKLFPPEFVRIIETAGFFHDIGKSDPRFQADLHNEAGLYALGLSEERDMTRLLAKSAIKSSRGSPRVVRKGFRHELLSVALAKKHPRFAGFSDDERDLALWLIGTHHGYGRPFFPVYNDPEPRPRTVVTFDGATLDADYGDLPLRLDQGWFELEARVRRRFGPWELARLEAVVRLADHRASQLEQEGVIWEHVHDATI